MFTGLITDIGKVLEVERRGDAWFRIACAYEPSSIAAGASICCSGACMTITDSGSENAQNWFSFEASAESLAKTTMGDWQPGRCINLERSLCLGDALDGHLVSGHVDGVGEIVSCEPEGASMRVKLRVPDELARFIAVKGSIALDGTSLTVNEVNGSEFGVNLIRHSLEVTTWGAARSGDRVNVEIDMLARYVARLAEFQEA